MTQAACLEFEHTDEGGLKVRLVGDWRLPEGAPPLAPLLESIGSAPRDTPLTFDTSALGRWDTALIAALVAIRRASEDAGLATAWDGLPEGAKRLLDLAFAVREREGARRAKVAPGFLEQVGNAALGIHAATLELLAFIGTTTRALIRMLRGQATWQRSDLALAVQEAGAESLPIVSLISFLIGMIFAFDGARQLEPFGAGIYFADLVAVAMVREMAPIMTAIVMAGRTGAAYAAGIGTMKVNEEIDALSSMGVDPVEFLVLPRLLALVIMIPLLTLYASLLGILGGALVSLLMLDIGLIQYLAQTQASLGLSSLLGGLFKAFIYGSLVAVAGCQQGLSLIHI